MVRRSIATLVGCLMLGLVVGACSESADGPAGVDSCDDLADLYVSLHQQAVDDVESADPAIPDGVDSGEDGERLNRILHVIGGLDWIERTSDIAVRWGELGCEPADVTDVLRDRVDELSYETPVGEYLVESYFGL
jgi:hypothetical protein